MVRVKHRYLLFHIFYPSPIPSTSSIKSTGKSPSNILQFASPSSPSITPNLLATVVRESIAQNFGDWGIGVAGSINVKYFSPTTSTGIIRIARDHYRTVWAALTFIREINNREVVFKVIRVSGTIKKVELAAIEAAKQMIERARELEDETRNGQLAGKKSDASNALREIEEDVMMVVDSEME